MKHVYNCWQFFLIFFCLTATYQLNAQTSDLLPPTHVHGRQEANKYATQTDLVNVITWAPPSQGITPVAYRIYRDAGLTKLAAIIKANEKLKFKDHNRKKNHRYQYFLVSVDAAGNQSQSIVVITFHGSKVKVRVKENKNKRRFIAIEVNPVMATVAEGFTVSFTAIAIFSDNTTENVTNLVTWTSSRPSVATVSNQRGSKGVATGISPGTTEIRATLNGISGSATLTVTSATLVSIEVDPIEATLATGFVTSFTAIGIFSDNTTENLTDQVTWTSSQPSVAAISNEPGSKGVAMGISPGSTQIQATLNGITGSATLTVTAAVLVSIEVDPVEATLAEGFTTSFTAIGIFSDNTKENLTDQVTWTSSQPGIATISNDSGSKGVAMGISPGSTQIQATLNGITGSATLTVTSAVLISIEVDPIRATLAKGFTTPFTAIGHFSDGTTKNLTEQVTWISTQPNFATISNEPSTKGVATALNVGSTQIQAVLNGISGSARLTVTPAVLVSIEVDPISISIARGFTTSFIAIGHFSDGTIENLTDQVTWLSTQSSVASISNAPGGQGVAIALDVGSTQIEATLDGITGIATLTVTSAVLISMEVDPINISIAKGFTTPFTAIGHFSDGTIENLTDQVTWVSTQPSVASVSNAPGNQGVATALNVGSTQIEATLDGITGIATLTVTPAVLVSIEVNPISISIAKGLTTSFTATGIFSDGTTENLMEQVTWTSTQLSVATISNAPGSQGVATALNVGSTQIEATLDGITGIATLTVTPAVLVAIEVDPITISIAKGLTTPFIAMGIFSDGTTENLTEQVTWNSSQPSVAAVSNAPGSQGLATALNVGSTQIEATLNGITGFAILTVTPAVLVSIEVDPVSISVAAGFTTSFIAIGHFSDGTIENLTEQVTWTSSQPNVATISNATGSKGVATALDIGSTQIQATLSGITGVASLTVTPAVLVAIEVNPITISIAKGFTTPFTAIGHFSNGTMENLTDQVTWLSTQPSVASVSNAPGSQGMATALNVGSTQIQATLSGIMGSATLTVTPAILISMEVDPASISIAAGLTTSFTAIGHFSDNTTENLTDQVTWISTQPGVATISNAPGSQGVATALSPGFTQIIATLNGISGSADLTVTPAVLVSIEVDPASISIAAGFTTPFTALGHFSDGSTEDLTTQVTWTSSQPSVATVSNAPGSQGVATALSPGSAQIIATLNGISGFATLTVTPAILLSIEVNPASISIAKGFTTPFTAIGHFSDSSTEDLTTQVTWTSSQLSVATISNASGSQGVATALNVGSTQIQATLSGLSGFATLTVTPAVLTSIVVTPANPTVAANNTVQFTAIGTFSDSSTENLTTQVTWSSSNVGIAAISNASGSQGLATGKSQGVATITATLNGVMGSTSITVTCPSFSITNNSPLPNAIGGVFYQQQLRTNSVNTPVTFAIIAGTLPNGFDMTSSGLIYGEAPLNYRYTARFTVQARSSCGSTTTKDFVLEVFPPI